MNIMNDLQLYIRFGSLYRFENLYKSNEFLKKVLEPTRSNVYLVDIDNKDDLQLLIDLLVSAKIKYDLKAN